MPKGRTTMRSSPLTGGGIASFVAIQIACIASFFFYHRMGLWSYIPTAHSDSIDHRLRSSIERAATSVSIGPLTNKIIDARIPSCAREVFVTLRRKDSGNDDCRGMLIRDDILVTSKECSQFNHTFYFAGLGVISATPHVNRHEKLSDSRLGFLRARPPYHKTFINQPVRRTRMFLSHRSVVNGTNAIITCDGYRPIAHNFPLDEDFVPIGQLQGIVSADILWEDTDLQTAPELMYKTYRWWTRAISLRDEERYLMRELKKRKGPPGSISVWYADKHRIDRIIGLCEALDPRGHRRDCFPNYYERWRDEEPFSGLHFFDWLDFGGGKFILELNNATQAIPYMEDDELCYKKDFNAEHVYYFNDTERLQHEVYITPSEDGSQLIWRYKINDEPVPESDPEEPHLYMWDLNKTFYVVDNTWDEEKYDVVKHTGLMGGMPALSGGKAYFGKNGAIWGINYSSGHYRPKIKAAAMMYQWAKDNRYNLTALHWVGRDGWSRDDCRKTDWDEIEIPGFEPSDLERSCYEVLENPKWMVKEDV